MDLEFYNYIKTQLEFYTLSDRFLIFKENKQMKLPIDLFTMKRRNPTELEYLISIDENGIFSSSISDRSLSQIQIICRKNKSIVFNFKTLKFDCVELETAHKLKDRNFNGFFIDPIGTIEPCKLLYNFLTNKC